MPREREPSHQSESILGKEFVDIVLGAAKVNLEKDGELVPALFLRLDSGEQLVVALGDFPATSDEKRVYLSVVGMALSDTGRRINEAIFVCEAWYVSVKKEERADLKLPPSQHPKRQEAIVVMGRNRERTRLTHVLQPFQRDAQNRPVFDEVAMAAYNIPAEQTPQAFGLVDYLFPPPQR